LLLFIVHLNALPLATVYECGPDELGGGSGKREFPFELPLINRNRQK